MMSDPDVDDRKSQSERHLYRRRKDNSDRG